MIKSFLIWILSRYYFSYKVLENYNYDVLHLNSSVLTDWLSAGKRFGNTIIHIREPIAKGYFGFRRFVFRLQMKLYADTIIAISFDNAKRINLPKQTKIIYNFTKIESELDINKTKSHPKTAIYMGGSAIIKGFLTMVDCLDYLDDDIKIIFCGHFPKSIFTENHNNNRMIFLKNMLKSFIPKKKKIDESLKKIRNHKNVEFVGFSSQIDELIKKSSFLINPFLITHFSRPVIEAFSNKRTVVSSNFEGISEIVSNNIDGFIVPKNNPKELAKSINLLCNNPKLSKKMGSKGYEKAKKYFSEKNILLIEDIYKSYKK